MFLGVAAHLLNSGDTEYEQWGQDKPNDDGDQFAVDAVIKSKHEIDANNSLKA